MRAVRIGEPITVTSKQHGYFPKSFVWRGVRHAIQAVEACNTTTRRHWLGAARSYVFRVRTAEATYELSQNVKRDTWRLERVLRETGNQGRPAAARRAS
ncbi:MAG: hypothetical protein HY784_10960 [Chloroflexi bacterium]|nr:hypothetical protein [Chloroflexota bacterium]